MKSLKIIKNLFFYRHVDWCYNYLKTVASTYSEYKQQIASCNFFFDGTVFGMFDTNQFLVSAILNRLIKIKL